MSREKKRSNVNWFLWKKSTNVNSFYKQEEIRRKKKYLSQLTKLIERVEAELEDKG